MKKALIEKLSKIQKELKAPKNQFNSFGKYKYRNCEDILEAVKPLMPTDCALLLPTDIREIGGHIYVEAKAVFLDGEDEIAVTAQAREAFDKKGMDAAQMTGTAISYARKYALNGLFDIDDTKDADTDEHKKETEARADKQKPVEEDATEEQQAEITSLGGELDKIKAYFKTDTLTKKQAEEVLTRMRAKAKGGQK